MSHAFLSPRMIDYANIILEWAQNYLMTANPNIHRPHGSQDVCPFVKGAIDNDSFRMVFHPEVNGQSTEYIQTLLRDYMSPFKSMPPFGQSDKNKKALLVIFPYIGDGETRVLDIVHKNIKTEFVKAGLMLGQFHKHCDDRGVYNHEFRVSVSPLPLMAIRHMAIHDILFLGDDEEWFKAYNVQFGIRFNEPEKLEDYNQHLLGRYLKARERFLK